MSGRRATAVVIDVLRATSTITLALSSGYERVLVAGSVDEAHRAAHRRPHTGRRGRLRAGAGLRPRELARGDARPAHRPTSSWPRPTARPRSSPRRRSPTTCWSRRCSTSARSCEQLAGREDVLLVCAGTDGRVSIEDVYLAGRLSARARGCSAPTPRGSPRPSPPRTRTPIDALEASGGAVGLRREGLESDIAFCAQESIVDVVGRADARRVDGAAVLTAATRRAPARAPTRRRLTITQDAYVKRP